MADRNGSEHRKQRRELTPGKVVKMVFYAFLILLAGLVILSSAITRAYGPYMGRVVDAETGESLAGAAVLMTFYARRIDESVFAGAMETLTDRNGEFKFQHKRFFGFHILSFWEPYGNAIIFKPGYGRYPGNKNSGPMFMPNGTLPENEYVIIKLPKLKTVEERKRNFPFIPDIPEKKMKNLLDLKSEERTNIGLTP